MAKQQTLWEYADWQWFNEHPNEQIRVRQSYEGEFNAGQVDTYAQFCIRYANYTDREIVGIGSYVISVKLDPHTRLRLPYWQSELAEGDIEKLPLEAELKDGGKTTTLAMFLGRLGAVTANTTAISEKYLEDMLPVFMLTSIEYDGDMPAEISKIMLATFEPTAREEDLDDSTSVRHATDDDHIRHSGKHPDYKPDMFPGVLVIQPFPGISFRLAFPHASLHHSDSYRFKVSTPAGTGTLGDYLTQAREAFKFSQHFAG